MFNRKHSSAACQPVAENMHHRLIWRMCSKQVAFECFSVVYMNFICMSDVSFSSPLDSRCSTYLYKLRLVIIYYYQLLATVAIVLQFVA